MSKLIYVPEFGNVEFTRSKRSKYIRIKYDLSVGVKVSYPYFCSKDIAMEFLYKRKDWIEKIKQKYDGLEKVILKEPDKKEGTIYLKNRLSELSVKYNLPYCGVSVKKMRTRWGSCNQKNKINLNLYLMNLPEELINYVIMHELCHTIEKNHSSKFWNLLEIYIPNAKKVDKKLNQFRLR